MESKSYLDLLTQLHNDVEENPFIPKKDKAKINKRLQELIDILFPYSY